MTIIVAIGAGLAGFAACWLWLRPTLTERGRSLLERERGELVLGGALADPPDQAVLVFRTDDPSVVENFVHHDPYVRHGLVKEWRVRAWSVVVGTAAAPG